jgi:hypothetical protein
MSVENRMALVGFTLSTWRSLLITWLTSTHRLVWVADRYVMNISAWSFKSHTANISLKETFHITISVVSLAYIEASLQTLVAAVNSSFTHAADCPIVVPPRDVAHVTKGGWLRLISVIIPYSSEIQFQTRTHQRGSGINGTPISSSLVCTHASVL